MDMKKTTPKSRTSLHFNESRLVKFGVSASPAPPIYFGIEVTHNGLPKILPSVGGITYNVQVGDPAFGWEADHIEPGISLGIIDSRKKGGKALNHFSCIGNTVEIISGRAKGAKGVVVGHHGGVEHVMVDFPTRILKKISYEDKFMIEAYGMGLKSSIFPDAIFHNLAPHLRDRKVGCVVDVCAL